MTMSALSFVHKSSKMIALNHNGSLIITKFENVVHFESEGNYTTVYLHDNTKAVVCKKLKDLEAILPTNIFIRIHHSHIINLHHITKYIKGDGGQVILTNGQTVDVSRRKKQNLMNLLLIL